MNTLNKYKQNLKVDENFVYSYKTKVARINHIKKTINLLSWEVKSPKNNKKKKINSSNTTSKHINYVGTEYNYKINKTEV